MPVFLSEKTAAGVESYTIITATGLLGAAGLLPTNSMSAARSAKPIWYVPEATRLTALPDPLPASIVTSSFSAAK